MLDIIQQSFKINLIVLKMFGLYPSENNSVFVKVRAYTLYFTLLVLATILTLVNLVLDKNSGTTQKNLMTVFVSETMFISFKVLPFLRYGEKIKNCINFFGHKDFAPKDFEEKQITAKCIRICRRNSTVYFYGIVMAEIVWNVPVIFSKEKKFPIYPWLPYDPTSTNLIYYAMLVYTTSVMLYDGFVATMTDPLIGGLAYHATAQIKILKYNLENIDKHVHKITMENEYSTIAYKMAYKHLKQCVNRHNHILNFFVDYEECFSWCVFWQFASSVLALCFCCRGSTLVAIASISSLTYFLCFLVISGQILFYCHYGTLLYEENKSLAESIYMGCWFQCDVKIRKVLIMMMERSKRSMVFTAGAVINVTFQTFLSVLKTSYSLVAVLNSFDKPVGE
ncbi:hypothetical protein Zmor_010301 [Zophobas morio]|uniref:Odorant receptor n=1 Tax=Zophobas morio TaxID=2755281 RepID=A0AA38MJP7_9CUCU|nr:hypothetical protein Zmor_010301 [Zophobas morio]